MFEPEDGSDYTVLPGPTGDLPPRAGGGATATGFSSYTATGSYNAVGAYVAPAPAGAREVDPYGTAVNERSALLPPSPVRRL